MSPPRGGKGKRSGRGRKPPGRGRGSGPRSARGDRERRGQGNRGRGRGGSGPPPSRERGIGGERVEGRHAVRELLLAGRRRVREVLLADDLEQADTIADICQLAAEAAVPVRRLPRRQLDAQAETTAPQGVLARADPLPEADLDQLAAGAAPFLLALDGVTDPHNLGALLRTADAAGVSGVILPRHRAAHVTASVAKAAAGAAEHVPLAVVAGLPAALSRLSDAGVWVVGLDEGGDRPLWELEVADGPVAIVLGAEGRGLGRLVRRRCDLTVRIPLRGHLPSLNVSVAGALALFEVARRRS